MNKRLFQRVRVPLGFILAAVFLYFSRPTWISLGVGLMMVAIGVFIRGWAAGHIKKAKELATSGPYAFTRNPLYLGSLFLAAGFMVAAGVWWLALIISALFIGIYYPVMRVEAEDIRNIFGDEYDRYSENVPLFLPRLTPWRQGQKNFDRELYFKNREYQAAMGAVAVTAILAAKAYFFN